MTITLTTPHNYLPGHGKPTQVCHEVKIILFTVDIIASYLDIEAQYGNTVEGIWQASDAPTESYRVANWPEVINPYDPENSQPANPEYNILVGTSLTSATGVPIYGEVSDGLYQWLLDKGHYVGTK